MKDVFSHPLPWLVGSPSSQGYALLGLLGLRVVYSSRAHWTLVPLAVVDADLAANHQSVSVVPL